MVKVSVQIPAYNSAKYLIGAIESVLAQTYKDYEIIVVDDGSTDNTREVLKPYMDKICYFYQENQGISSARNRALKEAQGEYIAFLDADDQWLPNRLEIQVPIMDNNPDLGFVSAATKVMDAKGNIHKTWRKGPKNFVNYESLLGENFVFILTVLARRKFIDELGGFDVNLRCCNDFDMWIRLAKRHPFRYIDEVVAVYRDHPGGISKRVALQMREKMKILKKPELTGHLNIFQKLHLKSRAYIRRALECEEQKVWSGASHCFRKAVLFNPLIGKDYWPEEAIGKRFTLPYRIMRPYLNSLKYCFRKEGLL